MCVCVQNLSDPRRRRSSYALPLERAEVRKKSSAGGLELREVEYLAAAAAAESAGSQDELRRPHNDSILKRIPGDAEATTVLVGSVGFLDQPTIAFVRLAQGILMPSITEVPVPVRFMFILLGPSGADLDYHEVGRSISTLMANPAFHSIAYKADDRRELLSAINEFLDDSIVLPPGDWERQALLPFEELRAKSEMIRRRKQNALDRKRAADLPPPSDEKKALLAAEAGLPEKEPDDPLSRSGRLFGGSYHNCSSTMCYSSNVLFVMLMRSTRCRRDPRHQAALPVLRVGLQGRAERAVPRRHHLHVLRGALLRHHVRRSARRENLQHYRYF